MGFLSKVFGTNSEAEKRKKFQEIERQFVDKSEMTHLTNVQKIEMANIIKANWLNNRGDDFRRHNQFDHAIEDYKDAIKLWPNNLSAYMSWGAILRKKGMLREATDILEKAPREFSGYNDYYVHELFFGLGGMYMEIGDRDKAIYFLEKSLKVHDDIQFNSTIMELQKTHKKSAKGYEQEWEEREINIEAVEIAKELLKQSKQD